MSNRFGSFRVAGEEARVEMMKQNGRIVNRIVVRRLLLLCCVLELRVVRLVREKLRVCGRRRRIDRNEGKYKEILTTKKSLKCRNVNFPLNG